jgi:hypothetical protein
VRRELYQVVTISGASRTRKNGRKIRDGDEARKLFNRVAAGARADTEVRLYYGDIVQSVTGGGLDVAKGDDLDEQQQRELLRMVGEE